ASPWAERALAELQASGETARVRDDRYRRQLTPQELQVALTLAEGATTREAAARLYLSPKTVEYHLRHVYDKLEVRTREELRAAVMSETRPQSSRKALMFTDLAGSTSLVEAIGATPGGTSAHGSTTRCGRCSGKTRAVRSTMR